ncbi:hypothetical protein KQI63_11185 [bacterium]|nr:hypothetical protein [bacterium]
MPTYTYACTECDHQFDLFHSISDETERHCPECGALAKKRIGAGVGLIFKGSGFYITDYKNGHSSVPSNGDSNGHSHSDSSDAGSKVDKSASTHNGESKKPEKASKNSGE